MLADEADPSVFLFCVHAFFLSKISFLFPQILGKIDIK